MALLLDNCLVLISNKLLPRQLLIEGGKITQIVELNASLPSLKRIDCKGKILMPGLIDAHVHFRCPGAEHKEDWQSGSKAAVAGGVTTVIDMPNNNPSCTTQERLDEKKRIAKKDSICNYAFHFGASNDNLENLKNIDGAAAFKVFLGSSTGNLLVTDGEKLAKIFKVAKLRDAVVLVHAEAEDVIKKNTEIAKSENWNHAKYHSKIRTNEAESKAISRALKIQEGIGNKLHICHISTKEGLELVRQAKKEGRPITCEVTPHHLFMDESVTETLGNFAKMNPSLKSKEDVEALWVGINDRTIDLVATDHAPHTRAEKEKPYWEAPSGVPGIETMLPLLLNAVNKEMLSLQRVAELCCSNPVKLYELEGRGKIKVGMDADLVLIDLEKETVVKNGSLQTKCNWSPFATWKLKGAVEKVFVSGKEVV
jgi:dihydroorotase